VDNKIQGGQGRISMQGAMMGKFHYVNWALQGGSQPGFQKEVAHFTECTIRFMRLRTDICAGSLSFGM
jgi:hypothetical protein